MYINKEAVSLVLLSFQICPLTSFYLAYWQWRRKAWKENLIETIKARYEMEPLELPKEYEFAS